MIMKIFNKTTFRVILSLIFAFFMSGCSDKNKTDIEKFSLKGKVKQLTEMQYYAVDKFGKAEKGDAFREEGWDFIMEFNEMGNFGKVTQIDVEGKEVGHTEYVYNQDGNLIIENNYDAEGGFSNRNVFGYDDKKRIKEIIRFSDSDNITQSRILEYNEKDMTITTVSYSGGGAFQGKEIKKLDKNGFPIETKIFNKTEQLVNHRKEEPGKQGLLEKLMVIGEDGSSLMFVTFKYDKDDNLILQEGLDNEGNAFLPVRYEYEFDNIGNCLFRLHRSLLDMEIFLISRWNKMDFG